jgi:hypothetical protein
VASDPGSDVYRRHENGVEAAAIDDLVSLGDKRVLDVGCASRCGSRRAHR